MSRASFKSRRTDYVKSLLKRFKETPILTLAKKAYKEQPNYFKTLEDARYAIRYYSGLAGKVNLKKVRNSELVRKKEYNYDPFNLPESRTVKREIWRLPKSIKKCLLLSDIHIPFQDNEAIETAVKYGIKEKVDAVFLNGDILDFYQISFHEKDPKKVSLVDELEDGRIFLKWLRSKFPNIPIYFIAGNHEKRLERWLRVKAPELLDMEEFRLDVLLRFGDNKITNIPHGTKVYFGKLLVEHGDKLKGSGGVNPARTLALKFKRHTICGHFHRTSEYTSKIYDGDVMVCYSVGCLCELEPEYLEVNEHNHGFAIIEMFDNGGFAVHNKKIVNKKVY